MSTFFVDTGAIEDVIIIIIVCLPYLNMAYGVTANLS